MCLAAWGSPSREPGVKIGGRAALPRITQILQQLNPQVPREGGIIWNLPNTLQVPPLFIFFQKKSLVLVSAYDSCRCSFDDTTEFYTMDRKESFVAWRLPSFCEFLCL